MNRIDEDAKFGVLDWIIGGFIVCCYIGAVLAGGSALAFVFHLFVGTPR